MKEMCCLFPDKEIEASEVKYLALSHPPGSVRGESYICSIYPSVPLILTVQGLTLQRMWPSDAQT